MANGDVTRLRLRWFWIEQYGQNFRHTILALLDIIVDRRRKSEAEFPLLS